jgi:hypothetical protein
VFDQAFPCSSLEVSALANPAVLVEIDAVAHLSSGATAPQGQRGGSLRSPSPGRSCSAHRSASDTS